MPGKSGQFVESVLSSREASVRAETRPKATETGSNKALQNHVAWPGAWFVAAERERFPGAHKVREIVAIRPPSAMPEKTPWTA